MRNINWDLRVTYMITKYRFIEFYRIFSLGAFALRFSTPLMTIGISWILYTRLFGDVSPQFKTASTVSYPTFIVIGNAVFAFVFTTLFVLGRVYFHEQMNGTIETVIMSPVSRFSFMFGVLCFSMMNGGIDFVVILLLGIFIFKLPIYIYHPFLFISGLILTMFAMFGVGLIVNWLTSMMRDRTNTVNILTTAFFVFSGIIVPISMLPTWGKIISYLLPLTYGINLIRLSTTYPINADLILSNIIPMILLIIIMIILGLKLLNLFEKYLKESAKLSLF